MGDVCYRCRFGRIKATTASFVSKIGTKPLVIPSVPAYTCDICGWMEYDADFLVALQKLMQSAEGVKVHPKPAMPDAVPARV